MPRYGWRCGRDQTKGGLVGKGNRSRKRRATQTPRPPRPPLARPDPVIVRTLDSLGGPLTAQERVRGWLVLLPYLGHMLHAAQEIEHDLDLRPLRAQHAGSTLHSELAARLDAAKRAMPDEDRYAEYREEAAESIIRIPPGDVFNPITAIRLAPLSHGPILTGWPPDTRDGAVAHCRSWRRCAHRTC